MPRYLEIVLNVGESRRFLAQKVRTTAGQSGVSGGDIKAMPLPLPPIEEQRLIVEEVERRLSVVDKLEATVEANFKQASGLRQSILKQAFSGKLIPQDPNDEPADLLLERIREERQTTKQRAGKKSTRAKRKDPADVQASKLFSEQGV
jgi:type I restriction enzyme, S subunit